MRIAASIVLALLVAAAAQASGTKPTAYELNIYEVRLDGSGQRTLLQNPNIRNVADISRDRTRLLFTTQDSAGPVHLWVAGIDGGDARVIATLPAYIGSPVWAPNGRRIAFHGASECSDGGCRDGIWVVNADGSALRKVMDRAIAPSWSPASSKLAVVSRFNSEATTGAVTVTNLSTPPRQRQLGLREFIASSERKLVWSPRGDQIAYSVWRNSKLTVRVGRANGLPKRSVHSVVSGADPEWSPTGKRLVVVRFGRTLWLVGPAGRHLQVLTTGFAPTRWSPDGRWIAFLDETSRGCRQIFVIRPSKAGRHAVTNEPCRSIVSEIYWSRDSKRLIYPVYSPAP